MEATLKQDAKILIPNKEHQNFTESSEILKKGTKVEGKTKVIAGLRRGKPFNYRIFNTTDNKIIYLNKLEDMVKPTEVILGADGQRIKSPTIVNLNQDTLASPPVLAAVAGALLGFGVSKSMKQDVRKNIASTAVGAIAGYFIGTLIRHTGIVKSSK